MFLGFRREAGGVELDEVIFVVPLELGVDFVVEDHVVQIMRLIKLN